MERHPELIGKIVIPRIDQPFRTGETFVLNTAKKFLAAVQHAGVIYRAVAEEKASGDFVAEISMDETDFPQTPVELLIILAAIGDELLPIQTIAPKLTGRFNNGVRYMGKCAAVCEGVSVRIWLPSRTRSRNTISTKV